MYKNTNKSPKDTFNKSDEDTNILAFNENGSITQMEQADAERIDHLKLAITEGNYTINTLRVAEKFIQFETQLSV